MFRPANTPHYPGLHNLGSRNWTTDERDPPPALGETDFAPRPYDKGAIRAGHPPAILLGTADCIANGDTLPLPVFVPPRTFPGGFDSRIYTAAGLPIPLDLVQLGTGGDREGGRSVMGNPFTSAPIGGGRTGGRSTVATTGLPHPAIGGSKEGGSAASSSTVQSGRGGTRTGGHSINHPQGPGTPAAGGEVSGGSATSTHSP